jgi:hypothetical protein
MTMTNPDAYVPLGDVFDFEGVPRCPSRHCDVVAIPAMEIGLAGIAQLRAALDVGEPGIREYLARTAGRDVAPEPGAPLPEACAWHGGEGDGRLSCPECHAEVERHRADERLGRTEQPDHRNVVDAETAHADEGGPVFGEAELRRADAYRAGRDEDCGCGLGADRCRAAEDGDLGD